VWATAAVLVGYLLGGSLGIVERWLGKASLLLGILAVLAVVLYLLYRWAANHPERIRGAFERLGGERIQRFLESPAGLWLRHRFSLRGAYGLALTAGLVLTGLFSWAFGAVVQDVVARDPLVRVDVRILEFFHSHSAPALTVAVLVFEAVFSPEVLLSAGAVAGCALVFLAYRRGDPSRGFSGFVLLAAAFGTGALSELFKFLFHRPRPPASLSLVNETSSSFPSAHAMTVVALGAAVWYLWSLRPAESWGGSWRAKTRVGLAVVALSLLVGLGRVYTGAHYPSDVLAGWALGGLWASICLTWAELYRRLRVGGKRLPDAGVKYAQFSLVGASNALVDLGTLNLLLLVFPTRSPATLVLYNLLALALTNTNSYLWNTLWTFRHYARHDARQIGMFAAQAALSIGVGSLVLWLVARGLVSYEGLSPLVAGNAAKVVSMIVGSTTSFVLLRFFIFRREEKR
jgi:undecaprenyl-diphosphatase